MRLLDGLQKYCVSFRIIGDELDPAEVTGLLHIIADTSHRKGDMNTSVTKNGKEIVSAPFDRGVWAICSKEDECATLNSHIDSLLTVLWPKKECLSKLYERGYTMDFFVGFFAHGCHQPGFELDAGTMRKTGELNIRFGMCFYT